MGSWNRRLTGLPRTLLVVAALLVLVAYALPLWNMTMYAPQYQDGLRLNIYTNRLGGGNGGQDVHEINVLNHYIGMRALTDADFPEFRWIPLSLAVFVLLIAASAVIGRAWTVPVVLLAYAAFGTYGMWTFASKLWRYGHELAPDAAVKVTPFMPPMFGYRQMANFEVYSYPAPATYLLVAVPIAMLVALFLGTRGEGRSRAPALVERRA